MRNNLNDIVTYLNQYLEIRSFQDPSENGLQVEGAGEVRKAGVAVDACLQSILLAARESCDLLVVHHGLLWGSSLPVRGVYFKRVRALIKARMALYAAHLPLDAHPEVGNNIQIARRLGLNGTEPFARCGNRCVGIQGTLPSSLALAQTLDKCREAVGHETQVLCFGPERVSRVGIVSGSATDPDLFQEASESGIDLLVTGEPKQAAYYLAQECGLNIFYGGHYRTETFGVRALGDHLADHFGFPVEFIDTGCPL